MKSFIFAILTAALVLALSIPAMAFDGGGGYAAPAEMSATVGIDAMTLDQAVYGYYPVAVGGGSKAPEATFNGDGEAAVSTSTSSFWEDLGFFGYCIPGGAGQTSHAYVTLDPTDPYKHIDPGRTGSAVGSLHI